MIGVNANLGTSLSNCELQIALFSNLVTLILLRQQKFRDDEPFYCVDGDIKSSKDKIILLVSGLDFYKSGHDFSNKRKERLEIF